MGFGGVLLGVLLGIVIYVIYLSLNALTLWISGKAFEITSNSYKKSFLVVFLGSIFLGVFSLSYFLSSLIFYILIFPFSFLLFATLIKKIYKENWKNTLLMEIVFILGFFIISFIFVLVSILLVGAIWAIAIPGISSDSNSDMKCLDASREINLSREFTCLDLNNNEIQLAVSFGNLEDYKLDSIQLMKEGPLGIQSQVVEVGNVISNSKVIYKASISKSEDINKIKIAPRLKEGGKILECSAGQIIELEEC